MTEISTLLEPALPAASPAEGVTEKRPGRGPDVMTWAEGGHGPCRCGSEIGRIGYKSGSVLRPVICYGCFRREAR